MIPISAMAVLRVLLGMLALLPARSAADLDLRWEHAAAIVAATDDVREQDVLTRIERFESGFRANVARCEAGHKGDGGRSLGSFQVQPITPADARRACGSPLEQAALAHTYVRRSAEACPGNVGADRLAVYVSGRCTKGLRQARERWGD
jgi:hypothetical protein